MRILLVLVSIFFCAVFANASSPKHEFRAVWIATVGNIDWPSKPGLSAHQQQQEFIQHLDFLQQHGFNAVIVQVRPAADAFYESSFEPWSRYLTGKQGQSPFPKYDPMAFMIEETHKRNMEFHAWVNPFRALVNSKINPNPPNHVTRTQPDWLIAYGGKTYFDPGNPAVRQYVLKVLLEIVKKYDIDALHIDDYFYPYRVNNAPFPDSKSYGKYNEGLNLADWRRQNVNLFVSQLFHLIRKEKSWVKFGVSPFGIWRNKKQDPIGSATNGTSCYDDLYADVRYWTQQKWVDYVAPQLYWEHGHRLAAYEVLASWWRQHTPQRHYYVGLGLYRMKEAKSSTWQSSNEILKQIKTARSENADGFIFYSLNSFEASRSLTDSLVSPKYFGNIALPAPMPWIKGHELPPAPKLQLERNKTSVILNWNQVKTKEGLTKYLVYRFEEKQAINLNSSSNIVALTQGTKFIDQDVDARQNYKYVVTTLDRLWNESAPSNLVTLSSRD